MAALIVFGRMSQDLELQAIRAAGIGLVPLVAPVILFGLFLSAVCFYNNAVVVPMTLQKFKSVLLDIGRDNPAFLIRAGEAMDRFPGYRIYIGKRTAPTCPILISGSWIRMGCQEGIFEPKRARSRQIWMT